MFRGIKTFVIISMAGMVPFNLRDYGFRGADGVEKQNDPDETRVRESLRENPNVFQPSFHWLSIWSTAVAEGLEVRSL